jgi:hypothetical protein
MRTCITLRPEQERVILDAINAGLAHHSDEALDQALDALRERLPVAAVRRLATFGRRHGLSLGGLTVRELLRESRP